MNNGRQGSRLIKQIILAGAISGLGVYANAQEIALTGGINLSSGAPDPATVSASGLADQVTGVATTNYGIPSFDLTFAPTAVTDGAYKFKIGFAFDDDNSNSRIEVLIPEVEITFSGNAITTAQVTGTAKIQILARNSGSVNLSATADVPAAVDSPVSSTASNVISFNMSKLVSLITTAEPAIKNILDGGINAQRHYTYTLAVQQTTGTTIKIGTNSGTFAAFPRIQTSCSLSPSSQSNAVFLLNGSNLASQFTLAYAMRGQYSVTGASGSAGTAPTAFTETCVDSGTGGGTGGDTGGDTTVEEDTAALDDAVDDIVIPADEPPSQEVVDQVNEAVDDATTLSENTAADLASGDLTEDQAIDAITTISKVVTVSGDTSDSGGTVDTTKVTTTISNMATTIDTLASGGTLTTSQVAEINTVATNTVSGSAGLITSTSTPEQIESVVSSTTQLINATLNAGAELSDELITATLSVITNAVLTTLPQLTEKLGTQLNVNDPEEVRAAARENPLILDKLVSNSVKVTSKQKLDDTTAQNELTSKGVSASARLRILNGLRNAISNTNGVSVNTTASGGSKTATSALIDALIRAFGGSSNQLSDGGLSFQALTDNFTVDVDAVTGAMRVSATGESYAATSPSVRVVPESVPEGVSYLPDGRALAVSDGLGIELAPAAADILGFAAAVEGAGFGISFRNNGSVSIDVGNNERFSGAFAFDNIAGSTGACGNISFTEPTGEPNTAAYSFGVSCSNGIKQRVMPFIDNDAFYNAIAEAGLGVRTDRNTGFITIDTVGNLKPSFFTTPLTAADQAYLDANGSNGFAFRAADVNGDGIMDYTALSSTGAQVLYGAQ